MNEIVENAVTILEERVRKVRLTEEDVELVQKIMPEAYIWVDNEVNVSWACVSLDDVKKVLRKFAKQKIMLESFNDSKSNPIWYLRGRNVKIRLCPEWSREATEGVTCRLVKVGETTHVLPVYELVCEKGGK